MASKITSNRQARCKLEEAIAALIRKAQDYPEHAQEWQTRELLAQAREYGRALNRIETMRG